MNKVNNSAGQIYAQTFSVVPVSVVLGDMDHIAKFEEDDLGTKKSSKSYRRLSNSTRAAFASNIRLGFIIAALDKARLYIIATTSGNCGSPSSHRIDGHCYTLHKLGPGFKDATVTSQEQFTTPVDDKIVELIEESLEKLYLGSIKCQASKIDAYPPRGIHTGALKFPKPVEDTTFIGSCSFSVPIL
ncbi:hypothetical protein MFIFM68171_09736 [Madurella fahalii]|uniref:Uncharacterized protein n=1 Tax=Madurella fahalii TaxID=1157608 RepID=A0ABQ0GP72_9PEZI